MRLIPIACLVSIFAAAGLGIACGSNNSSNPAATSSDGGTDGSSSGSGDDAGEGDAAVEAAPFPAFVPTDIPQVATRGGSVMPLPKVVPILFAGDDPTMTASIQDFVTKLGATDYWKGATAEYGVGQVVGEAPINLTAADTPPSTYDDSDLETWLTNKLQATTPDPGFGTPDANTIYTFFFPAGVSITMGGTSSGFPDGGAPEGGTADAGAGGAVSTSCVDFGGYHSAIQLDAAHENALVAYAVVPRCANFDGFKGIDAVTAAASHEIAEAATDPFLDAYLSTDNAHRYWATVLGGGEVGDMCAQNLGSFVKFPELPYLVQRIWSNKTALTGGDPCTPVPTGEVYFNTIPVSPDTLQLAGRAADGGTATTPTKGVQIAVGASKTIELDLFSTAPTPSTWSIQAFDEYDLQLATAQQLKFSFDKNSGQNGDKVHMTIQVVAAGRRNTEPFLIISTLAGTQTQNLWAGVVGQ